MSDIEPQSQSNTEKLLDALKVPRDQIIVDIGSNGYISTSLEDNSLLVLVDPKHNPNDLEWGDNETDDTSEVLALKCYAEDIVDPLYAKADRVQMICPDPDLALGHMKVAKDMLKPGGEVVIIFDKNSNKHGKVKDVVREISDSLDSTFTIDRTSVEYDDPKDLIGGDMNSDYNPDRIVIVTKLED
jgi:hypothetical protein